MKQCPELDVTTLSLVEAQAFGHGQRHVYDVPAVGPGVSVVGFDHIAQQKRGAAIGLAELESAIDACSSARGQRSRTGTNSGKHERDRGGMVLDARAATSTAGGMSNASLAYTHHAEPS